MSASAHPAFNSAWPTARLGDIADVRLGKMLDKTKHRSGTSLPYLRNINVRWGSVDTDDVLEMFFKDSEHERYSLRAGDVLVCEGGEPGRAAVWDGRVPNAKYQKALHRVRFKVSYEPRLFVYLLELLAKTGRLERRFTGSTIKHLTRESLVELPIPVPTPEEQRRIVEDLEQQLSRLDAGVAALKRIQANLKRYRAAVLKAACEGRLVPTEAELARRGDRPYESASALLARVLDDQRRERGAGQTRPKGSKRMQGNPSGPVDPDGCLPEGWAWASIDQLARGVPNAIKAGPFGSALKKSSYVAAGFKIYGQEQVIRGDADFGDYFIGWDAYQRLRTCRVGPGDILISLVGTAGRALELPEDAKPGIINPRLVKVTLHSTGISRRYFQAFVSSPIAQRFFKHSAHGQTMDVLNLTVLRAMPLPLPPRAEQDRIVADVDRRLSLADHLNRRIRAHLDRAVRLRHSVLAAVFVPGTRRAAVRVGTKAPQEGSTWP